MFLSAEFNENQTNIYVVRENVCHESLKGMVDFLYSAFRRTARNVDQLYFFSIKLNSFWKLFKIFEFSWLLRYSRLAAIYAPIWHLADRVHTTKYSFERVS